jgi:hypothetical protein
MTLLLLLLLLFTPYNELQILETTDMHLTVPTTLQTELQLSFHTLQRWENFNTYISTYTYVMYISTYTYVLMYIKIRTYLHTYVHAYIYTFFQSQTVLLKLLVLETATWKLFALMTLQITFTNSFASVRTCNAHTLISMWIFQNKHHFWTV